MTLFLVFKKPFSSDSHYMPMLPRNKTLPRAAGVEPSRVSSRLGDPTLG